MELLKNPSSLIGSNLSFLKARHAPENVIKLIYTDYFALSFFFNLIYVIQVCECYNLIKNPKFKFFSLDIQSESTNSTIIRNFNLNPNCLINQNVFATSSREIFTEIFKLCENCNFFYLQSKGMKYFVL